MLRINCPWCGARDMVEFTYVGDATVRRPDMGADSGHYEFVYLRDNPKGVQEELWHHVAGCRQHVAVRRHMVTHEILASGKPDSLPSGDAPS
jgi:heterotetrameric sarcosine oxidase delta subunit